MLYSTRETAEAVYWLLSSPPSPYAYARHSCMVDMPVKVSPMNSPTSTIESRGMPIPVVSPVSRFTASTMTASACPTLLPGTTSSVWRS